MWCVMCGVWCCVVLSPVVLCCVEVYGVLWCVVCVCVCMCCVVVFCVPSVRAGGVLFKTRNNHFKWLEKTKITENLYVPNDVYDCLGLAMARSELR